MPLPQPVVWQVSTDGLETAILWACKKLYYSIDRPGMNRRPLPEKLDDKIMGDLATVAVLEYLGSTGVAAVAYDQIRRDDFRLPDPGWDIVIGKDVVLWGSNPRDPTTPTGLLTASIRSSRLPRTDTLEQAVRTRDFKIFAPVNKNIAESITTDVEIQVYYNYRESQLDTNAVDQRQIAQSVRSLQAQEIMDILSIERRFGKCFLTAWNYKTAIVQHARTLPRPYWESFGKRMWFAPLRLGKDFRELQELS